MNREQFLNQHSGLFEPVPGQEDFLINIKGRTNLDKDLIITLSDKFFLRDMKKNLYKYNDIDTETEKIDLADLEKKGKENNEGTYLKCIKTQDGGTTNIAFGQWSIEKVSSYLEESAIILR